MATSREQAIGNILTRLNAFGGFHPVTASLFSDWTLEPGDIVTLKDGETGYRLPVMNYDLDWKGAPMIEVKSTGAKKRPDPTELQKGGYGAGRKQEEDDENAVKFVTRLEKNEDNVFAYAGAMGITLDENGNPVIDEDGKYVYDDEGNNSIFSQLELKPNKASLISEINSAGGTIASGKVEVSPGHVLIEAINANQDSSVTIRASQIDLDGIVSAFAAVSLTVGDLTATGGLTGQLTGNVEGDLDGDVIGEGHTGYFQSGLYVGEDLASVGDGISDINLNQSGDTYTIQYKRYGDTNWSDLSPSFSRATTLTGAWSSGDVFPLSVNASPQGEHYTVGFTSGNDVQLELVSGSGAVTSPSASTIVVPLQLQTPNGQQQPTVRYTKPLTVGIGAVLTTETVTPTSIAQTITAGSGDYEGYVGFSSVTIEAAPGDDVRISSITGPVLDADKTRTSATITATATNSASDDATLTLASTSYTPTGATATQRCVNLSIDGSLIGRINIQGVYEAGVNAAADPENVRLTPSASGVSYPPAYSAGKRLSTLSVTKTIGSESDSDTITVDVTALCNWAWDLMVIEPYTITSNGTYDPGNYGYDGFGEITVNVPSGGTQRTATSVNISPRYDSGHIIGATVVVSYNNGTSTSYNSNTTINSTTTWAKA